MNNEKMIKIVFGALLVIGTLFHAVTLPYSSNHWQDEAQICEMGRRVFERTDWNVYMMPDFRLDAVPPGIWLVGPMLDEMAYRVMGHLGPKIVILTCLVFATLLVRFYLWRKAHSELIADVVSLIFFAAPALTQSARGARVDVVAFMWLFLGLALMQVNAKKVVVRRICVFGFGGACALSIFTWPTAILVMPIAAWEFWDDCHQQCCMGRDIVVELACAVVGGLVFSLLAIAPIMGNLQLSLESCRAIAATSMDDPRSMRWNAMIGEMCSSYGLYAIGAIALLVHKRFVLLLIGAISYFVICSGSHQIYVFKTLYFLPFAIVGMAMAWHIVAKNKYAGAVACMGLMALLCLIYGRSVVVRNVVAYLARSHRNVASQTAEICKYVKSGAKVYNVAWQTYFIGREQGWQQYQGKAEFLTARPDLLNAMDCVLVEESQWKPSIDGYYAKNGFVNKRRIEVPPVGTTGCEETLRKKGWLLPLGPYLLYTRE